METKHGDDAVAAKNPTSAERASDRETVVKRTFDAPAALVYKAWTTPELLMRWWAPKSFGITFISCEVDARTGGSYRFVFAPPGSDQPMPFFGRYIEATPTSRLVWTNEEGGDQGQVTTVTFEESGGRTLVVMRELYPSKEALDAAIASGGAAEMGESFDQLDDLLPALAA